ncbi:ATP-dependent Clp protease proteolytic subunit [uncultured Clostridium sp.]|nr:ATP-dependent Clp protease proteolytic subunit [uncultured Clostridium sp.]
MSKKYFQLTQNNNEVDIQIYGDITSWDWYESDVSSYTLSKQIEGLECDVINVYINSYGGEVAEGLSIYNQLKRHKAKVKTVCDGFACSAASVIFMAGDERVMSTASLLMIHNAWTYASGNAKELRKQADDLDVITQASINAYMQEVNITEEELKQMLDNETWIAPQEALEKGFITTIVNEKDAEEVSQSVKKSLMKIILNSTNDDEDDNDDENKNNDDDTTEDNEEDEEPKNNYIGSFFNAIKNL